MAATAVIPAQSPMEPVKRLSWTHALLQDLEPTPGRLHSALRVVLASIIALVLMEALQMPFIAIGMYFIFLIGRDSPAVSFRSGLFSFGIVVFAIVIELVVVILTDNDPVARLLSVAVVTFVSGMIVVTTNTPALGSSFGLIYCTVISLWESHAPADHLVKSSLYLVGTFIISLGSAVAVEYLFGVRNPADKLQEQRHLRYSALETLFRLYAQNAPPAQRFEAASRVSRIAIAGQSVMMSLYNTIVERNLDTGSLPIAMRPRITMLAQLMDVAAAFGLQNPPEVDPDTQRRCALIADECRRLIPGIPPSPGEGLRLGPAGSYSLLDRVEGSLHAILTMPRDIDPLKNKELVTLPSSKVPFFIPGAIRRRESVAFGLKISLCATFCYILYHALAWPGIATSVTTVLVTGLSSTGAIKQRLVFRLLGSAIGGLILGLGATVFLFPHMDSITSLVVLEAVIAFVSAWIAAGPKFNYIGLQIAFSFYIVAYEGLTAPTELAPARDRLAGVLIALAAMWLVFDQLWPVRTTEVMRQGLASVLRLGADLFATIDSKEEHADVLRHADILRDQLGKTVAGLRSMNGAVPYEFGLDRERHIQTGDMILRATLTAAALFWNQLAVLHNEEDLDYLTNSGLHEMRLRLSEHMSAMADALSQRSAITVEQAEQFVDPAVFSDPRYGEYARNTAARYSELQNFTAMLSLQT
jgi:multidrug resistance protein MdtO